MSDTATTHRLVGQRLPEVMITENNAKVSTKMLFGGKKAVIFAVPGAFTPGCTMVHLPGYVKDYDALKAAGVDIIACVAVNDGFVVEAWGKSHGATDKIHMLADVNREFTKAMNMELDLTALLGNVRSKRYSLIADNMVITHFNEEPDKEIVCSVSTTVLQQLKDDAKL